MINEIRRSITYRSRRYARLTGEWWTGVSDRRRLARALPVFARGHPALSRWREALAPVHDAYCRDRSDRIMAMSLETAAALAVLIEGSGARRIADLGSGFSSYVARKAAPDAEAWSVDDSDEWIEVTRTYLREHEMDTGQLVSWKEFLDRTQGTYFDLVFHDLGIMETRIASLPDAIRRVKPGGGWLLLDDMHMIGYAPGAWPRLREAGFTTYSLRSLTIDSISRFAVLARAQ